MADTPESKPPFWSSLPGILTGFAGVIAAITGLITVLYTTRVIGPNADSNNVPPVNTVVNLASAPGASPLPDTNNDRYKALAGNWEIIQEPSQIYDVRAVSSVTWRCEAAMSSNLFTLKGKLYAVGNNRILDAVDRKYEAIFETKLEGLSGNGQYTQTNPDGGTYGSDVQIELRDNLKEFEGKIKDDEGNTYKLTGRKLP